MICLWVTLHKVGPDSDIYILSSSYMLCVCQEQRWLCEVFEGVRQQLYPLISSSVGLSVEQLTLSVLSKVHRAVGSEVASLPVSYRSEFSSVHTTCLLPRCALYGYCLCAVRFVSLSELTRQQHTPCCCSLTWSSAHYREQARRAEQALPNHRALTRDNILLMGYLYDGSAAGSSDGGWWVRDAGGAVSCRVSKRRTARRPLVVTRDILTLVFV